MANRAQESLHRDIKAVLFSEEQIRERCESLGGAIATDYADKAPLVLVTLAGAYMFAADLLKCVHPVPPGLQVDFIRASSYGAGTESSGSVAVQVCLPPRPLSLCGLSFIWRGATTPSRRHAECAGPATECACAGVSASLCCFFVTVQLPSHCAAVKSLCTCASAPASLRHCAVVHSLCSYCLSEEAPVGRPRKQAQLPRGAAATRLPPASFCTAERSGGRRLITGSASWDQLGAIGTECQPLL